MIVLDKLKKLMVYCNEQGVMLPLLHDPIKKAPSVSLTFLFISGNVVLAGLLGKAAGFFGGIDISQALYWFGMCAALYFSRSFSGDGKQQNISNDEKKK